MRRSASDEFAIKLGLQLVAIQQIVALVTMPDERLTRFQANLKEAIERTTQCQTEQLEETSTRDR